MTYSMSLSYPRVTLKWRIFSRFVFSIILMVPFSFFMLLLEENGEVSFWTFLAGNAFLCILGVLTTRVLILDGTSMRLTKGFQIFWISLTKTLPLGESPEIKLINYKKVSYPGFMLPMKVQYFQVEIFNNGSKVTTVDTSTDEEAMEKLAGVLADVLGTVPIIPSQT